MMTESKKFYDNSFWEKGSGLMIWQHRLLDAILAEICYEGMPRPFITHIYYDNDEPTLEGYEGVSCEWTYRENPLWLNIEIEGRITFIHAMDVTSKIATVFAYTFGDETDPSVLPYAELPEKLKEVKQWVLDNPHPAELQERNEVRRLTDFLA